MPEGLGFDVEIEGRELIDRLVSEYLDGLSDDKLTKLYGKLKASLGL